MMLLILKETKHLGLKARLEQPMHLVVCFATELVIALLIILGGVSGG